MSQNSHSSGKVFSGRTKLQCSLSTTHQRACEQRSWQEQYVCGLSAHSHPSLSQKKVRKLVYMGQLQRQESFGELSALLQLPFTCTVVAGAEVEAAVIQDKDLHGKHTPSSFNCGSCYLLST